MAAERFVKVIESELPDLDAALVWVVQAIEREGFDLPSIEILGQTVIQDDERRTEYEASVRGNVKAATDG